MIGRKMKIKKKHRCIPRGRKKKNVVRGAVQWDSSLSISRICYPFFFLNAFPSHRSIPPEKLLIIFVFVRWGKAKRSMDKRQLVFLPRNPFSPFSKKNFFFLLTLRWPEMPFFGGETFPPPQDGEIEAAIFVAVPFFFF